MTVSRDVPAIPIDGPVDERLRRAWEWITEFVILPNPALGREGDVCPYMARAVARDLVDLRQFDSSVGLEPTLEFIRDMRDELEKRGEAAGSERMYHTSVIVPYGSSDEELTTIVDGIHRALKPEFVARGMMVGEFWPEHEAPGVHNPDFRSQASPVPLFVLRFMVPTDVNFLSLPSTEPRQRLIYLEHYRRSFAPLSGQWARKFDAAVEQANRELAHGER
jgi:hypothetical protein